MSTIDKIYGDDFVVKLDGNVVIYPRMIFFDNAPIMFQVNDRNKL